MRLLVYAGLAIVGGLLLLSTGCGESRNGLFVVSPDGGKEVKVASGCIGDYAWSPDGDAIVISHGDEIPNEVEVVNHDGGRIIEVERDSSAFTWSPDGSKIAYILRPRELWVRSTRVERKPMLIWTLRTKGSARVSIARLAWAPDGKHIALQAGGIRGQRIALVRPEGGGVSYLTGAIADSGAPIRWFPNGKRLLFLGSVLGVPVPAPTPLFVVNVDGSGLRRLATLSLSGGGALYSISPDGARVAYSFFDGSEDQLYVVNADGSMKRRLGKGQYLRAGDWSPDGTKIVVWRSGTVYVIKADGTGKTKIASDVSDPSWSSRGEIAYINNVGCFEGPS